jgi:hypothetical protein
MSVSAQDEPSYADLVNSTSEVELTDSILIEGITSQMNPLDSITVKKWFSRLLPTGNTNRLKNRNYYLAGKITSHTNFDLLLLLEEKKRADSTIVQVVYLVTTKKDGAYISSLEAAVTGTRKKTSYYTSSWLYKDYKIVKDSQIMINQKTYDELASYKINGTGRFVLNSN